MNDIHYYRVYYCDRCEWSQLLRERGHKSEKAQEQEASLNTKKKTTSLICLH